MADGPDDLGLLVRTCMACGQKDTDPKHVIALADQSEIYYHMDCHSRVNGGFWGEGGCPVCIKQTEDFSGKGGDALREHLIGAN